MLGEEKKTDRVTQRNVQKKKWVPAIAVLDETAETIISE